MPFHKKTHIAKRLKDTLLISVQMYLIASLMLFPLQGVQADETHPPDKEELTQEITNQANQELQSSLQENTSQETTNTQNPNENQQSSQTQQSNETTNTGDSVTEQNDTNTKTQDTVSNDNSATINQEVNATANTGHNEASRNISFGGNAGVIVTGDAGVETNAQASANNNTTSIGNSASVGNSNSNTANSGNALTKTTSSQNTRLTMVNNDNQTVINQHAQTEADTGHNKADGNISIGGNAGVILTGSAYTSTNFLSTANGSVVLVGGENNGNGPGSGASIVLLNTGDNNDFASRLMRQRNTTVRNNNSALIAQSCGTAQALCMANTGYNSSNRNIGLAGSAGVIQTGDALVYVDLQAEANNNETEVSGAGTGSQTQTDVTNTGDNSTTDTSSATDSTTTIENNNDAGINQEVNALANTGYNTANRNISFGGDAGVIYTGNAAVIVNLGAKANENSATLKEQPEDPIATNIESDPTYTACASSQQSTDIVNTGNNLDTTTSANTTTTTNVTNTNKAFLTQSIIGNTNTGMNSTNRNIGNQTGIIQTGNAVFATQINANANSNTTTVGCDVLAKVEPTPSPTEPPATPTPTDTPNPTTTPTTTPPGNGSNDGGNSDGGSTTTVASTSSVGYKGGVPFTSGDVLGASVSRLPTTGPENMMSFLLAAFAAIISGGILRKTPLASRRYTLTFKERG